MKNLHLQQNPKVLPKFEAYPAEIRPKMERLRTLILETAAEIADVTDMEETLKWGEPSYLVKKGSTIRIDWKAKNPVQYAIYFKCTSKLVPTFRTLYGDLFKYEKNRAILFDLEQKLPIKELKACIRMALRYHTIKERPLLGMDRP